MRNDLDGDATENDALVRQVRRAKDLAVATEADSVRVDAAAEDPSATGLEGVDQEGWRTLARIVSIDGSALPAD